MSISPDRDLEFLSPAVSANPIDGLIFCFLPLFFFRSRDWADIARTKKRGSFVLTRPPSVAFLCTLSGLASEKPSQLWHMSAYYSRQPSWVDWAAIHELLYVRTYRVDRSPIVRHFGNTLWIVWPLRAIDVRSTFIRTDGRTNRTGGKLKTCAYTKMFYRPHGRPYWITPNQKWGCSGGFSWCVVVSSWQTFSDKRYCMEEIQIYCRIVGLNGFTKNVSSIINGVV